MAKAKNGWDKNLTNEIEQLAATPVNAHQAQQLQQDKNDRRNQEAMRHKNENDTGSAFLENKEAIDR